MSARQEIEVDLARNPGQAAEPNPWEGKSPAAIRQALGLPDDMSDEQVRFLVDV